MTSAKGGARPGAGRKPGLKSVERRNQGRMVSLPPADWEMIDNAAEKLGVTRSSLVRVALLDYIAKNKDLA